MSTWQLQDAKARFSEVVESAVNEGPQLITRRGEKVAVLVSMEEYDKFLNRKAAKLASEEDRRKRVLEFLRSAPPFEIPERHPRRKRKAS